MHILTKVGNQDNVVTYEHICDTLQDRDNIEKRYITLGSTCLVLSGENDTIEVYMADSNKEWHDIAVAGGSGGGSGSGGLQLYICTASEVQDGKPAVEIPMEDILYLVPGGTDGNLYTEYMYVNNNWELFGGATVDLTNYASKQWVQDQHYLSSYTETDPTVPAWAKAASKPNYTAVEVGALPSNTVIPQSTSQLTNDSGFISEVDTTLSQQGEAADAKATGDALATKLTKPATDGTNGQVLITDGQGGVSWQDAAKVVSVEGTTPSITATANTQYICGEVSTLSFTPAATGISDIIFESGSTATVLTVPNTVKFPDWFDATALEPNMVYEISIMNGTYGAVIAWATT